MPQKCAEVFLFFLAISVVGKVKCRSSNTVPVTLPVVINTWPFTNATDRAWQVLTSGGSAMDALVAGCSECEQQQCDGSVGYGGHPDEEGETTLDAMVMDGNTHEVGAVGALRQVKEAIAVARAVMHFTDHTLLVGDQATAFAVSMGFNMSDLHTNTSVLQWNDWIKKNCQPNYRKNVIPDASTSCGPYRPQHAENSKKIMNEQVRTYVRDRRVNGQRGRRCHPATAGCTQSNRHRPPTGPGNHDTIGMVIIDSDGAAVGGTSTNGLSHRVPGRVGDSPLVGAGVYADSDVGGAAATGDGDVMMRFVPSFHVVELMRMGMTPSAACSKALRRIGKKFPEFQGALVAVTRQGEHGAGCHGLHHFTYSVRNIQSRSTIKYTVKCR